MTETKMMTIPLWVVQAKYKNGSISVFGKGRKELPLGSNFSWYLKEYGYKTKAAAKKDVVQVQKMWERLGFSSETIHTVEKIDLTISEEDARDAHLIA